MLKRSPIIKKKCKGEGCEKYPVTGFNGFCPDHVPQLLKEEKINRHLQSKRKAQQKAKTTKALHDVQREVGKPKFIKRSTKPIPFASKKRLAEIKIYSVLRKDFLKDHPICECGMPDCDKSKSVDIHHPFMGRDRAKHFMEVDTWIAVSRKDHRKIHDELSTEQMIEYGLRKFD